MNRKTAPADTPDRRAEKDRFLSEFVLALAEGVDLPEFLQSSVRRIGEILDVDRVALFFFDETAGEGALVVRSSFAAEGIAPLPRSVAGPWNLLLSRLRRLQPLASADVLGDPELAPYREAFLLIGTRSLLAVPISIDGALRGVVGAATVRSLREWTADEVSFLESAVRHLAAALKQKELVEELGRERDRLSDLLSKLEQRTHILEAVTRATQLLNFRLHAPDVLSSIVEETSRAFPSSDGSIVYVADPAGNTLSVAAVFGVGLMTQRGWGSEAIPLAKLKCAGRAFLENRPFFLEVSGFDELAGDESAETRARARAAVENAEVRQLMAAPIRVGSQRLGVVEVLAYQPDAFSPADAETLVLLAEQAAIALRNARLIEELQRSNRLKDDFLANLSHEVRTPLTGIVGWAEVLLDSRGDDPQVRRALEAILGQAEALSRMLADLIDLSRIDNFGLEMRRAKVRLADVIADSLDAVSPGAAKRDVVIRCRIDSDLPEMEGDAGRLKQVVWNLLTNGVKFSPPGSTVDVAARAAADGGVELVVMDQGVGIAPDFLPHVFERFRQEESSSNRRFGGLGVGLSIARAIVEAHGGTIEAASEGRERGARFRVCFPPGRMAGAETASPESGGATPPVAEGAGA